MDRTHFEILTFDEADKSINDHKDMSWKERMRLLLYLNSIAYGYVTHSPPIMDRHAFESRKLS